MFNRVFSSIIIVVALTPPIQASGPGKKLQDALRFANQQPSAQGAIAQGAIAQGAIAHGAVAQRTVAREAEVGSTSLTSEFEPPIVQAKSLNLEEEVSVPEELRKFSLRLVPSDQNLSSYGATPSGAEVSQSSSPEQEELVLMELPESFQFSPRQISSHPISPLESFSDMIPLSEAGTLQKKTPKILNSDQITESEAGTLQEKNLKILNSDQITEMADLLLGVLVSDSQFHVPGCRLIRTPDLSFISPEAVCDEAKAKNAVLHYVQGIEQVGHNVHEYMSREALQWLECTTKLRKIDKLEIVEKVVQRLIHERLDCSPEPTRMSPLELAQLQMKIRARQNRAHKAFDTLHYPHTGHGAPAAAAGAEQPAEQTRSSRSSVETRNLLSNARPFDQNQTKQRLSKEQIGYWVDLICDIFRRDKRFPKLDSFRPEDFERLKNHLSIGLKNLTEQKFAESKFPEIHTILNSIDQDSLNEIDTEIYNKIVSAQIDENFNLVTDLLYDVFSKDVNFEGVVCLDSQYLKEYEKALNEETSKILKEGVKTLQAARVLSDNHKKLLNIFSQLDKVDIDIICKKLLDKLVKSYNDIRENCNIITNFLYEPLSKEKNFEEVVSLDSQYLHNYEAKLHEEISELVKEEKQRLQADPVLRDKNKEILNFLSEMSKHKNAMNRNRLGIIRKQMLDKLIRSYKRRNPNPNRLEQELLEREMAQKGLKKR